MQVPADEHVCPGWQSLAEVQGRLVVPAGRPTQRPVVEPGNKEQEYGLAGSLLMQMLNDPVGPAFGSPSLHGALSGANSAKSPFVPHNMCDKVLQSSEVLQIEFVPQNAGALACAVGLSK